MKKFNVGILGAEGRMGIQVAKLLDSHQFFNIYRVFTLPDSLNIGKNYESISQKSKNSCKLESSDILKQNEINLNLDIVIDFSSAPAAEELIPYMIKNQISVVSGTTGFSDNFLLKIENLCKNSLTSCFIASNMSFGISIIQKITEEISNILRDWKVEIVESHHQYKKDAPSGTALNIAQNIKNARSDCKNEEIPIHSIRLGKIIGDHQIIFANDFEIIKLSHSAQDRVIFANGAIKATEFLNNHRNEGRLFTMKNLIQENSNRSEE